MKHKIRTCALKGLASVIANACAQIALAQTAGNPPAEVVLAPVTVSVSRSQAMVEAMPLYTTIVSRQDIEQSSAQTLDQLLRDIPGMNFTAVPAAQSDPTGHQTKMRGLGNAKVLVLLDGIPVHDPFYLTTQWFKIPLTNIDHVEVVRGGNSSLWGNMAVAGVVNVITRVPADNGGQINVSGSSTGTTDGTLAKDVVLSDTLSANLYLERLNYRGFNPYPSDQMWRYAGYQPSNAQDSNAILSLYYKPDATVNSFVRIGQHKQDQDINIPGYKNTQSNPDISAGLSRKINDHSSVSVSGWAQYVEFEKYNASSCYWQSSGTACPSSSAVTVAQSVAPVVSYYAQYGSQRYREQGASGIYSTDQTGMLGSLQVGADYRHLSATDFEYFYKTPTSLNNLENLGSSTYGTAEQTFSAVFAQTHWLPLHELELTASARLDSWSNSSRINSRTTAAGVTSGGPQPSSSTSAFDPTLAARYSFSDDIAVRGAAYRSFRAPGFNNTIRTYGTTPTIANPDLTPETLFGREIGFDYAHGNFTLGATYYQYDIQNMIATYAITTSGYANAPAQVTAICGVSYANCTPSGTTVASYYTNDQNGSSNGLELFASWKASDALTFNGSYTNTNSYITSEASYVTTPLNTQLTGLPWDVVTAGVTWKPDSNVVTHLQLRYIGPMNIDYTSKPGTVFQQSDVSVLDASSVWNVSKKVQLSVSVVNLLDTVYSENAYAYNQPWARTVSMPRTFTFGLNASF